MWRGGEEEGARSGKVHVGEEVKKLNCRHVSSISCVNW